MTFRSANWLLIVSLLLVLTLQGDYHLEKQTKLCCVEGLNSIQITKDDTLTVRATNPSVAVFQGQNYQTKSNSFNVPANSQIKVTPGGIFVTDQSGSRIAKKNLINNNKAFSAVPKWFDLEVTEKYAIFVEENKCPVLKQVVFQNMTFNTIPFSNDTTTCEQGYSGCLQNIQNGQIIFGQGRNIFILDNQTLQVKQTLNYDGDQKIIYDINSFYDTKTKDTIFVTQREQNYQSFIFNKSTSQYQNFDAFQAYADFTFISTTQAISAYDGKIYWWSNLDKKHVLTTKKDEFPPLPSKDCTLSWSQNSIACYFNNTFYSYTVDGQYNLMYEFNITIPELNTIRQLSYSYDNSHVYLLDDVAHILIDVDLSTQTYSIAQDSQGNDTICWSFLVLPNYILTAVANQTECVIEVRFSDTLIPISSLVPQIQPTFTDVKLVGNDNWNNNFVLLVTDNTTLTQNNSVVHHFTINNITITQNAPTLSDITFDNAFASNKYLVTVGQESGMLTVIDSSNLQQVASIFTFSNVQEISVRSNYVLVQSSDRQVNVYNFSKTTTWLEGSFIYAYYQFDYLSIIFTTRDTLGHYQLQSSSGLGPLAAIYNLAYLPLQKIDVLPFNPYTSIARPKVGTNNQACYQIFAYIDELALIQYDGCTNNIVQTFSLIDQTLAAPLYLSDFGDYLIFIYQIGQQSYIDLRPTSNLATVFKTIPLSFEDIFSADVTKDGHLIILHVDKIQIIELQPQTGIESLGILEIIDFDVSPSNTVVLSGVSIRNTSQYAIAVKQFASTVPIYNTTLFAYKPVSVAISDSSSLIAYFDSNFNVRVINVTSKKFYPIISNSSQLGVVKFIGEDKLLIDYGTTFQVLNIFTNTVEQEIEETKQEDIAIQTSVHNSVQSGNVISPDGTLVASIVGNSKVQIYNSNRVLQNVFVPPQNQPITGIAFKSDNTLLVATSSNTLYYLSPTACPATYINKDSVCLCIDGQYSDQQLQQCVDCSFACSKCDGSGLSCIEYSGLFYFLVIGLPIIVLSIIVIIVWRVKKSKTQRSNITGDQKSRDDINENLV